MFDPKTQKHLISDLGEVVIDEVKKHWAALVSAALEMLGGVFVMAFVVVVPSQVWWLPVLGGAAIIVHGGWRILDRHVDRFVITNMRVFRVHGILSQRIATMPLARILDISVHRPLIGRMLGYGHFIFESAAQEQGLREIKYVGDPDGRGLTIQRVIQQAGLRGLAAQPGGMSSPMPVSRPAEPARTVAPVEPTDAPAPAQDDSWRRMGWLEAAQLREAQRIAELRGEEESPYPPFDPDRTTTAPIDLPRTGA
nr:PH domain-containing protein [Microbacterium immunditiarum]